MVDTTTRFSLWLRHNSVEMPLTRQCEDEIQAITGKDSEDAANIVQDVVKHFVEKEAITFEDIKPYVSMYKGDDGKMTYDVLDKDEKSVFKGSNRITTKAIASLM